MADIKWNDGKIVFGDDGFEVNSGTPEEYSKIGHDETDALKTISAGSAKTIHIAPTILADDGYIDLPAETSGRGFILIGDAEQWVDFEWESDNTVALIDYSSATYIDDADTDTKFCMFDNTDSVRIKNRLGAAKRIMFDGVYTENILAPMFQIFKVPSGVDNLDPYLTINGVTVTPKFRYKGGDADSVGLEPWGYGETLTRVAVATPPTYNDGSPGLGANDDACKFNGSDYYKNATAVNQITTGDFVFEIIWKNKDVTTYMVSTSDTDGFIIATYNLGSGCIRLTVNDADENIILGSASSSAPEDTWSHAIVFVNRDENSTDGSRWYVNGLESGSGVNFSTAEKTLVSTAFALGASITGTNPTNANIAYVAAWEYADWMQAGADGPTEWALIAKERFQKFCGIYPEIAHNSANLLVDGDMEAVGVTDWATSDSTLAKDTTAPLYEGTKHLRITSTANTFWAYQNILTSGVTYRITGAARSVSDSAVPEIRVVGGVAIVAWQGTTSTDWQEFDVKVTSNATFLYIGSMSNDPGVVDFDDVTVTCLGYVPITATRAFNAYVDKLEGSYRKLYYVGSEWLRMCKRQDSLGENVFGYLPETAATNLIIGFEDFTTAWVKGDAGDTVTNDAAVCPDGRTKAASIGSDATSGAHYLATNVTLTAATYAYSIFAKPAPSGKDWILLYNATGTAGGRYFDVANGTVGGAIGAGTTGYIEGPFYNGFYRCCMVFTGTAAAHSIQAYAADGDNDYTISDGDGSPDIYFWGAQCELGDYMTSPIRTDGSALTRLKDNLQFVAGENIGGEDIWQGTIRADVLMPDYSDSNYHYVSSFSDGGSGADRVEMFISNNTYGRIYTAASGGNTGSSMGSADLVDGEKHKLSATWELDNITSYTDGVAATPDTTADMPDDLDQLHIGMNVSSVNHFNGLLQNLRIYNISTTKGIKG